MSLRCQVGQDTCKNTANVRIFKQGRIERNQGVLGTKSWSESGGSLSLTKISTSNRWELKKVEPEEPGYSKKEGNQQGQIRRWAHRNGHWIYRCERHSYFARRGKDLVFYSELWCRRQNFRLLIIHYSMSLRLITLKFFVSYSNIVILVLPPGLQITLLCIREETIILKYSDILNQITDITNENK